MDKLIRLIDRLRAAPARGYAHWLACEEALRSPAWGLPANEVAARFGQPRPPGPFNSLDFTLYQKTRDKRWLLAFKESAAAILLQPVCSAEGAWLHPCGGHRPGCSAVLLDSFQEEASRLVKLAWLIRRGEPLEVRLDPDELEEAACRQFVLHRAILRDPATGLWSNGRGWIARDPACRSPGAWSRGHGWLLRGLMECLDFVEHPGRHRRLSAIFRELVAALMRRRAPSGVWHALLNEPHDASPPESSGSALIVAALLRASRVDSLCDAIDSMLVEHSACALLEHYLNDQGVALSACSGPGPLVSDTAYREPARFPANEPHGLAAFCALAAAHQANVAAGVGQ